MSRDEFEVPDKIMALAKLLRKSSGIANWLCECVEHINKIDEREYDRIWQDEAFSPVAPSWAIYEPEMMGERCGDCKAWCTIVRPGKTQCDNPNCNGRIY